MGFRGLSYCDIQITFVDGKKGSRTPSPPHEGGGGLVSINEVSINLQNNSEYIVLLTSTIVVIQQPIYCLIN